MEMETKHDWNTSLGERFILQPRSENKVWKTNLCQQVPWQTSTPTAVVHDLDLAELKVHTSTSVNNVHKFFNKLLDLA